MGRSAEAWQEMEEANEAQRDSEMEQAYEEYQAQQEALPSHKRDGWAELMYEQADMRRKQLREAGK